MSTAISGNEKSTIQIENAGPIAGSFVIDLSEGPGLYELSGSKGTGKSTVLSSISLLAGHKTQITVHDGELAGSVHGFGVTAPIASRKRRHGELEVNTIDSEKFDLVDLISPPQKTAETRDATRIKALASLSGLLLAPADFYGIAGGRERYDDLAIADTDDAITLAGRVKQAMESRARTLESIADVEDGHAKGLAFSYEDIDDSEECDADTLADAAERAASEVVLLEELVRSHATSANRAKDANESLRVQAEAYKGPTLAEALAAVEKASSSYNAQLDKVDELNVELAEAEKLAETLRQDVLFRRGKFEAAEQHESTIEAWEATILAAGKIERPSEDSLEKAIIARQLARSAQERGAKIRDAAKAKQRADHHIAKRDESIKQALAFRLAAREVWDILASKMQTTHLRIESVDGYPRLVVTHPTRGKCFFDQVNGLSDGERVRVAIDELLPKIPRPGLVDLPQRVYQDLPPADRRELQLFAKSAGLYLFGAQVTDGELRVTRYAGIGVD